MTTIKSTGVDRVIDAKELVRIVPVSLMHIWRLERAGEFPARIRLGSKKVGWILSEVMAWIEAKKTARGPVPGHDDADNVEGTELLIRKSVL